MKKLSIFLCLLGLSAAAFAKDKEKATMPAKKNAVKLNITSLAYKNFGVQYERALTPKIAVAGQLRFMPKGTLGGWNSISDQMSDGNSDVNITTAKVGSFAFTPEFRFYPKHVLRGFYLAPYLRIRSIGMEFAGSVKDSSGITRLANFDGSLFTIGGGLMIGSHFNIGKSFSLDWFILGLHYSSNNGTIDGNFPNSNLSAADQSKVRNEIQTALDDSRFFKNNVVTVTPNTIGISTKFGMVGFRGFGLNFGYRF